MEAILSAADIIKILPHRYPFLLIDKVVQISGPETGPRVGRKVVAIKNVTLNEPHFTGHFPGRPIMPGVLLVEAMAQALALAYRRNQDPLMNFAIASIQEAKFRRFVVPGDTLQVTAEVTRDRGAMICGTCQVHVDGQLVSEVDILATVSVAQTGA